MSFIVVKMVDGSRMVLGEAQIVSFEIMTWCPDSFIGAEEAFKGIMVAIRFPSADYAVKEILDSGLTFEAAHNRLKQFYAAENT